MIVTLDRPWLDVSLGAQHRVLSWSLTLPGYAFADRIVWREVRNADLPDGLDVTDWLHAEVSRTGRTGTVAMLTSRDIRAVEQSTVTSDGAEAACVATVGLSNAERTGSRLDRSGKDWGTINIAVRASVALTDAALLETLSIAAQARTAAVIDTGHVLPTGVATGTGTDCIAVAAPAGATPYAGLHTPVGEAVGRAVYDAVRQGAEIWMKKVRREGEV